MATALQLAPSTTARTRQLDALLLICGLSAAGASIAVSEILLGAALVVRIIAIVRRRERANVPHAFRWWLLWAGVQIAAWLPSPDLRAGLGEIRHLFLIAAMFLLLPALRYARDALAVWRGLIAVSTVGSLVLIMHFFVGLATYHGALDPVVYLRGGGLLHHWMIYSTVEVLVFAGLLSYWSSFAQDRRQARRWLIPVTAIHAAAIVLSLTRMLWIACLVILALHLIGRRSRLVWVLPAVPAVLLLLPGAVRERLTESVDPAYYSNAERAQMLEVGLRMIERHPLTGVGAGRVEALYPSYLAPGELVPAYHGHLHNNAVQIAAQSGLPALGAGIFFLLVLFRDLRKRRREARNGEEEFLSRSALLGLTGYLTAGMFDYTYGHSLGLIVFSFVAFAPLYANAERSRISNGAATARERFVEA
jgi:O-antigen ligase